MPPGEEQRRFLSVLCAFYILLLGSPAAGNVAESFLLLAAQMAALQKFF